MAVHCAECGEELLGAVNRCWRCGREFAATAEAPTLPPVRRTPVDGADEAAEPEAVAPEAMATSASEETESLAESAAQENAAATQTETVEVVQAEQRREEPAGVAEVETESGLPPVRAPGEVVAAGPPARLPYTDAPVRRGSPFAAPTRSPVAETPAPYEPAPAAGPTQYPQHTASIGGAYACLLLGVVSVVGSFSLRSFPPAPLVTAVIGMGMGTWGLYSKHRMAAVVGLLLCCVAIALASFFGAVLLYEMIHGRDPFAPDLPVEEIDVL